MSKSPALPSTAYSTFMHQSTYSESEHKSMTRTEGSWRLTGRGGEDEELFLALTCSSDSFRFPDATGSFLSGCFLVGALSSPPPPSIPRLRRFPCAAPALAAKRSAAAAADAARNNCLLVYNVLPLRFGVLDGAEGFKEATATALPARWAPMAGTTQGTGCLCTAPGQ